ncbi:peptidase [Bordetella genomosp. 1]|uniref:Peptidase n=1 Tax=Bordetella genomosp. 1 TaxID=1395607 RepID=A0A261SQJ8_9BORD|nr:PepSY-associated TM helix domain-containing protein [Bordetella genomosp. 1]OZI39351.1 peptidase [Bordetella genomosp. 1]
MSTVAENLPPARKPVPQGEGLRQAMSWLHTWSGLIFGWVLFAMFLTGTLAFFRPEITRWMQPEIEVQKVPPAQALAIAQKYLGTHAADSNRWFISLPSDREPAIHLSYQREKPPPGERAFKRVTLDPATGDVLSARETRGGDFFYRFHFELEMGFPWGRWIASIAGMFMLVAIISGVITHKKIFTDFFTFRPKKGGQRAWMDGHNALSVLGLPFHLMITFSGLILFVFMLMPASILAAYDNDRQYFDEMFPAFKVTKPTRQAAPLVDLNTVLAQAEAGWEGGRAGRIVVNHPNDAGAVVTVTRSMTERVSFGRMAPTNTYNGVTGELVSEAEAPSAAAVTAGTIVGLHLGLFAEPLLRWFYFLVSLAGTAMVGTGLVLWIAKRRQKAPKGAQREAFSLRLVDALNAGTIAGIFAAMAAYFLANRLLDPQLADHSRMEVRVFFWVWGLSFVYAFLRQKTKWRDLMGLATLLFALIPLVNVFTTQRHLGVSLLKGDWIMAGFDLTCLATALTLGWITYKSGRAKPQPAARAARPAPAAKPAPQPAPVAGADRAEAKPAPIDTNPSAATR